MHCTCTYFLICAIRSPPLLHIQDILLRPSPEATLKRNCRSRSRELQRSLKNLSKIHDLDLFCAKKINDHLIYNMVLLYPVQWSKWRARRSGVRCRSTCSDTSTTRCSATRTSRTSSISRRLYRDQFPRFNHHRNYEPIVIIITIVLL